MRVEAAPRSRGDHFEPDPVLPELVLFTTMSSKAVK